MNHSRNEHTIATTCAVAGRGYWSGKRVQVKLHPAPVGSGIRFVRTDLIGQPSCPALVQFAKDANFRTNLLRGDAKFAMVEHVMAALAALEVDNCVVEVDGEELPGLDGSSIAYVEALRHAGLIVQARQRRQIVISETFRVEMEDRWIEASPSPDGTSYFEYRLSYEDDTTPIPPQTFGVVLTPHRFTNQVARARTFVTAEQAATLRAQGVASHVTNQDLIVFGKDGPLDNRLYFSNECARHKTLDLIGDLALAGADLIGRFVAFRGGHILNGRMARRITSLAAAPPHSNPTTRPPRFAA